MDHILFGMVKAVVDAEQKTLTPLWEGKRSYEAVLDTYLG